MRATPKMQEEEIFLAALQIASLQERSTFVSQQCGDDPQLLTSVESLLQHDAAAGDFLERPPTELDPAALRLGETHDACNDNSVELPGGTIPAWTHRALAPADRPGLLGRLDHYDVIDIHGSGGMAVVFRAFDPKLARLVAIKMLAPELAARPAAGERFLREARATALVRHPNVVTIHAIADQGPLPYLVMEFVRGHTLQQEIDSQGPLELQDTLRIGFQIAEGLAAAHAHGLVHRDIKPANILLEGPNQLVKIADFGLAQAAHQAGESGAGESGAGENGAGDNGAREIAGTPQYMSPEQARGLATDRRSDLFCLGGVLYAMCTGRPPCSIDSALAALRGQPGEGPTPMGTLNPAIPTWLAELIHGLLETEPDRRPQSADEVAAEFRRRLTDSTTDNSTRGNSTRGNSTRGNSTRGNSTRGNSTRGKSAESAASPTVQPSIQAASPDRGLRLTAAGVAALLVVCAVVFVVRNGGETTRIEVPDGATVKVAADGTVQVELPAHNQRAESLPSAERRAAVSGVARVEGTTPALPSVDASAWETAVRGLPADRQVKMVVERMRQLNPDFDGQLEPTIEAGQVTGVQFVADNVTDLSPLRALTELTRIDCGGSNFEQPAKLADLAPLQGLQLQQLTCSFTLVANLEQLQGMPLRSLNCAGTLVSDLRPLSGRPLRDLSLHGTRVADLTPLRGMLLDSLNISHTRVTDISPLSGMPLQSLYMDGTSVGDLSPLRTLRLHRLNWRKYDPNHTAHADAVKAIATLEDINGRPADQFWRDPQSEAP